MPEARKKQAKHNYTRKLFFLDDVLHRRLFIDRGLDEVVTWNYSLQKRVVYTYSDVKKRQKVAYSMARASEILGRSKSSISEAISRGDIERPQEYYVMGSDRMVGFAFSEENLLEARAFFATRHRGKKRKDGRITPQALPTARQVRAMVRNEPVLYVKDGDEFKPVWQAQDFD